ncbi:MAG TPA: choice-of-anchor Q domain-containing protein [Chitinophagaceae bacterium]|nr:choice-of-anchor Q domain-containing protein [Chitinophagaceae bacterium]
MKNLLLNSISILILFNACKKDSFITSPDAQVSLSTEEVKFDTVFTTSGSITQSFKIINENDQKLRLSSVKLMGGNASNFKINADGFTGPEVSNIEVAANDSVYVFVSVSINQSTANLPFIVKDSIQVNYNGTTRQVNLEAWGQNAHFYRDKKIIADEIWNNDLPYVILGSLTVDANKKLTINKGCRIYVHADAPIIVDGTLEINGAKDTVDRVQFRGDRLDEPYNDFPGGWPGIYFRNTSKDNVFNYAVIKNAYQALAVIDPSLNANPKLTLNECIVDNAYDAGIVAINSSIRARNCLVSNCGKNVILAKGGDYQFIHCTVASISNSYILHRDPVLFVSNYVLVNNTPDAKPLTALFRNCIFWGENGTVEDEVLTYKNSSASYNVTFDQVLWKVVNQPTGAITPPAPINNIPPRFDSINTTKRYYSFRLKDDSPAKNKATNAGVTIDLDGKPRPVGVAPDLGCYEKQ